jgi:hypothetical protein
MAFNELENIPGVVINLQDGNLTIPRPLEGASVVILGACVSGQAAYTDPLTLYQVFEPDVSARRTANHYGTVNEEYSEISKAIFEAYSGGARDIRYMNIDVSGVAFEPVSGTYGSQMSDSDRYTALNSAYAALLSDSTIDIIVPVNAMIDASGLTSNEDFGYQLANFCYLATASRNQCIGVLGALPASPDPSRDPTYAEVKTWVNNLKTFANCPNYDGRTPNSNNTDVDPTGNYKYYAYTDNDIDRLTDETSPLLPSNPLDAQIVKDADGTPIDIGLYINVTALDLFFVNKAARELYPSIGYYQGNGAAAYAGLISSLNYESAPTGKTLGGAILAKPIALPLMNELNTSRFVCAENTTKGLTISNAMTGAHNVGTYGRSDFVRLTTVRITFEAIDQVRRKSEPFIGEPNTPESRAALDTAIRSGLVAMREAGMLQNFDFTVVSTPNDQVLGRARVNMNITPAFELVKINVEIALAFPLATGAE